MSESKPLMNTQVFTVRKAFLQFNVSVESIVDGEWYIYVTTKSYIHGVVLPQLIEASGLALESIEAKKKGILQLTFEKV